MSLRISMSVTNLTREFGCLRTDLGFYFLRQLLGVPQQLALSNYYAEITAEETCYHRLFYLRQTACPISSQTNSYMIVSFSLFFFILESQN